jgi:hypothetical protein
MLPELGSNKELLTSQKLQYRHVAVALSPLLFTPALVYLFAEGILNAGGGEKDLVLVVPYLLWATIFLVTAVALILKRWQFGEWMKRSLIISFSSMLSLWVIVWVTSSLGIV